MLIAAARYKKEGGRVRGLDWAQVLGSSPAEESEGACFDWVAVKDPSSEEVDALAERFKMPELVREDIRKGGQRPKLEEYSGSIYVCLTQLRAGPDGVLAPGDVHLWVGKDFAVCMRGGVDVGFSEVRQRCEEQPELLRLGPAYALYAVMDAVVDRYFPILFALGAELEAVEAGLFESPDRKAGIQALYAIKERLMTLRHASAPLLEATGRLFGGRVPTLCVGAGDYFRDIHDHLLRIGGDIEGMRETIGTAIQVNISMIGIEDNEVTKRLASWAAIFAACTFMAGIWGMNFEHMPELKWQYGYPLALCAIAAVGGGLWGLFKKSGWL